MSITDELRDYVNINKGMWGMSQCAENIRCIADRIDKRYHRDMATAQQVGINEGEDAALREGWIKLPVDADGEVIHIGEEMVKPDGWNNRLFTVDGMTLCGDQWSVQGFAPHKLRHHHPTVEDVLREFAQAMNENIGMYMGEAVDADEWRDADNKTIAEYAAKLRLAGDDE